MSLLTDVLGFFQTNNALTRAGTQQLNALQQAGQTLTNQQYNAQQTLQGPQGTQAQAYGALDNTNTQTVLNTAPYTAAGANAALSLSGMTPAQLSGPSFNFDPSQVINDPSFQYTIDQAMQALNRKGAGMGARTSGGTAKEELAQATGLASQNYAQAYNRAFNLAQTQFGAGQQQSANTYNRLLGITGVGEWGTGQNNAALQNFGNQTAGLDVNIGTQIANQQLGLGNQLAGLQTTAGQVRANQTLGKATNNINSMNNITNSALGLAGTIFG